MGRSRLRPRPCEGGGTLALVTGFLGVLTGTEAAYYSYRGAASGDDFTGLVALIGGFVL